MSHFSTEPDFTARRDDYRELLARASRRRNRRRTAVLGTIPAVTAVWALALTGGGPGTASLATHDPEPSASEAGASPSASPSQSGLPLPGVSAPPTLPPPIGPPPKPSPSPKPSPTETETGHPRPSHDPGPPPPSPYPDEPATFTYHAGTAPVGCQADSGASPSDPDDAKWCWRYVGPTTFVAGERAELPFEICRSDDLLTSDGVLHRISKAPWMKLGLHTDPQDPYDDNFWGGAAYEPKDETVAVAAGDCVRWTVPWHGRNEYGGRLEPGAYKLDNHFLTKEGFQDWSKSSIAVTVTAR